MPGSITTSMCTSFKQESWQTGHNFNGTVTPTGNTTNGSASVTSVSSMTGLAVGQSITGTGIPASTTIIALSGSTLTLSANATATNTGTTLTSVGDTFNMAIIKFGMAGTYGASTTNYSNITGNSDEVSSTGYTAGGQALTNTSPTTSGTTAYVTFNNPSWSGVTFSAEGCMIYNASSRLGTTGRACSVHDFGGQQQVTSGTFTVLMPTANSSSAILRLQ